MGAQNMSVLLSSNNTGKLMKRDLVQQSTIQEGGSGGEKIECCPLYIGEGLEYSIIPTLQTIRNLV